MSNITNAKHFVDIHEAMLLTNKSKATIYRWAENKEVDTLDISGIMYFDGLQILKKNAKNKLGRPRHAVTEKKIIK